MKNIIELQEKLDGLSPEDALAEVRIALEKTPDDSDIVMLKAEILYRLNENEKNYGHSGRMWRIFLKNRLFSPQEENPSPAFCHCVPSRNPKRKTDCSGLRYSASASSGCIVTSIPVRSKLRSPVRSASVNVPVKDCPANSPPLSGPSISVKINRMV